MRGTTIALFAATVAGVGITVAIWLVVERGSTAPPGSPAADVYAGVAVALTRPGMIAHLVFRSDEPASLWTSSRREAWLDVAGDVARTRTTTTYQSPSVSTTRESGVIYRTGARYTVGEDGRQFKTRTEECPQMAVRVLSLLADCPRASGTISTRTESGRRFDGIDTLAVVMEGQLGGIDSVVEIHNRLFVDASSDLPLAFERKGTDRYAGSGYEQDIRDVTRFAIDFVPRDSLVTDFFEPAAIGYALPDLEQTIDGAGEVFPIFWPGAKHAGADSGPAIVLTDARVVESAPA